MNKYPDENGVFIAPMTVEEQAYASLFIQVCRKYNINISQADEMEREFAAKRAKYYMKQKLAV